MRKMNIVAETLKEEIVCLETEEIFNSVKEVQNKFGISKKILINILNREKRLAFKGYHFVRKNDLNCSCKEKIIELEKGRKNFPTSKYNHREVICLETGEIFKGEYSVAVKFGTYSNRVRRLCLGVEKCLQKKYHFCYLNELDKIPAEKIIEIEMSKGWRFKNKIFENFNLENLLEVCFEKNEWFEKMMEIIRNPEKKETNELHHIIPRSFFKKSGYTVVDKGNLVNLSAEQHLNIHLYAAKCAKEIIKKEMIKAYVYMSDLRRNTGEEYQILKEELKNIYGKKVLCLDTMEIFNSKREVARKFNIDRKSLNSVLKGEQYVIGGLHFEDYTGESNEEYCKLRIEQIEKTRYENSNKVRIICLNNLKIYDSLNDACIDLKIKHSGISNCINGKIESNHGYYFEKYIEGKEYKLKEKSSRHDNSKKEITNVELKKTYSSIAKALKDIGKSNNGDFNKLVKETDFIFGYHWKIS